MTPNPINTSKITIYNPKHTNSVNTLLNSSNVSNMFETSSISKTKQTIFILFIKVP